MRRVQRRATRTRAVAAAASTPACRRRPAVTCRTDVPPLRQPHHQQLPPAHLRTRGHTMTRYAIPDPPPATVTQVWDAEGQVWCRLEHEDPSMWVPWDTPTDEGHVTEEAITWRDLLIDYGPICDRPPEGGTMTLADIAARCHSEALPLREAATYATAIGNGKIAQQAIDRFDAADALATLLDRLARVPAANSYPPYVDAARRLARLAGVDL